MPSTLIVPIKFKTSLNSTLGKFAKEIQPTVKELFLSNETIHELMQVKKEGEEWFYFYEIFVLLAEKKNPTIITQY